MSESMRAPLDASKCLKSLWCDAAAAATAADERKSDWEEERKKWKKASWPVIACSV